MQHTLKRSNLYMDTIFCLFIYVKVVPDYDILTTNIYDVCHHFPTSAYNYRYLIFAVFFEVTVRCFQIHSLPIRWLRAKSALTRHKIFK